MGEPLRSHRTTASPPRQKAVRTYIGRLMKVRRIGAVCAWFGGRGCADVGRFVRGLMGEGAEA